MDEIEYEEAEMARRGIEIKLIDPTAAPEEKTEEEEDENEEV